VYNILLLLFFLFLNGPLFATLRILTFHCNQPDFIELQYKTLKTFLLDDFELIVFNDAKTEKYENEIADICKQYQIQCVRFKPEWHLTDPLNAYLKMRLEEPSTIGYWGWDKSTSIEELGNHPSVRHSHVIQYALDHYGYDHDDIVVIMDGDNFLIESLSFRELLGTKDIVGFHQRGDSLGELRSRMELTVPEGMEMFWVVFIAFNPQKLPDVRQLQFHVDVISGHPVLPHNTISDTGAALFKYLWAHPELRLEAYPWQCAYTFRCFGHQKMKKMQMSDLLIQFINDLAPENVQFFLYEHFMHIASGSWEGVDPRQEKRLFLVRQFLKDLLVD
jgi:hypothetical protein